MSIYKNVAVIGTGVIGTGWVIRCLAHGKKVDAYDINLKHKNNLIKEIKRTWPFVKKMFSKKKINFNNLSFHINLNEALKNAEFIFECAPENYNVKTKLMKKIGLYSKRNSIISSSSSGLLPSKIYSKCKYPERGLIGHPFNPVYLLPGVEIVPGKKTKKLFLNKAKKFYETISMKPIMVKKELPGYLADRLQEALWREGLHIINENFATTKELDRAIEDGPGLRYSLMGTFLTFHLAGGNQGMKHMLRQFGPALKLPWTRLDAPELTPELRNAMVDGCHNMAGNSSFKTMAAERDQKIARILKIIQQKS